MIPLCLSLGGGIQLRVTDVDVTAVSLRDSGGAVGAKSERICSYHLQRSSRMYVYSSYTKL